jgi:hypothetical protein
MSRLFGEIRQNGYVVRDLGAALTHWIDVLQVGPFYVLEHVQAQGFHYRGEPGALEVSFAFAHSGPLQIELIQQHGDTPSMYRDFLAAGHEGLQHVAYWTDAFDALVAKAEAAGFEVGQGGAFGADGRFVYFANEAHPGSVVEVSEVCEGSLKQRFFEAVRNASVDWDGSESIRRISLPD